MKNEIIRGIPASPSIAIGRVFLFMPRETVLMRSKKKGSVEEEIVLFENARKESLKQLKALKDELEGSSNPEPSKLIDVQILLLQDTSFVDRVESKIRNNQSAAEAIMSFLESVEKDFKNISNGYFSERYLDIKDVGDRLLKNFSDEERGTELTGVNNIIVAERLSPTETIQMAKGKAKAIVTGIGGRTSHTAIIAEALDIPAVVGIGEIPDNIKTGDEIIVDGMSGIVVINPDESTKRRFEKKERVAERITKEFLSQKDLPATTIDGYSIDISANIELLQELSFIEKYGAKGVGLLRTEFLYLTSDDIPDEEAQFEFYSEIADVCFPDYVIVRTLDIGGDKVFKRYIKEANPFLGWRGIRFSLSNEKIFKTQIRAILRSSAKGNIRLLIPMVSQVEEMVMVREVVEATKKELQKEGVPFDENIEIGAMVEVPSVCLLADHFAKVVDFFSIGTNDLTQYALAVDRGNERISDLYDHLDPSVLELMRMTVEKAHKNHKWVGVCGEIAADLVAIPILIGLEVDELSLPAHFIPQVKKVIRGISKSEGRELLIQAIKKRSATEVRGFLLNELISRFPSLKNILVEV
ncbi:phosphoenolpyruvate--protein phosphotransferase [candidate division WOR-3 bacterium]|nr:phosphoenolpyruvate--protein phosphotransferase [candidate division WOR-3 bacterium]